MRYYILCVSDYADVPSYILAEVMRDTLDDGFDRNVSLASGLAGERALVLTQAELLASHEGADAIKAWSAKNDANFNRENRHIRRDPDPRPRHLYAVGDTPRSRAAADAEFARHDDIKKQKKAIALKRRVRKEHTGGKR